MARLPNAKPAGVSDLLWDITAYMHAACAQSYIEGKIGSEQHLGSDTATRNAMNAHALKSTEDVSIRAVVDIHNRLMAHAKEYRQSVGNGKVLQ